MEKERAKEMICKAIDNIPDCAEIKDCYVEHGFGATKAYIKIIVEAKDESDDSLIELHNAAHDAFGTDMGFVS